MGVMGHSWCVRYNLAHGHAYRMGLGHPSGIPRRNHAALALFCLDKARAVRGAWRIPEKVLLGCSAVGGAAGGLLGMRVAHHKTRKPLFYLGVPAMLIVQAALLAWLTQG